MMASEAQRRIVLHCTDMPRQVSAYYSVLLTIIRPRMSMPSCYCECREDECRYWRRFGRWLNLKSESAPPPVVHLGKYGPGKYTYVDCLCRSKPQRSLPRPGHPGECIASPQILRNPASLWGRFVVARRCMMAFRHTWAIQFPISNF